MSGPSTRQSFGAGFALAFICVAFCVCTLLPLILLPVLLYRCLVFQLATWACPDLVHPLRGHGAMFISEGPHVDKHMNILLELRVRGVLDFEKAKHVIRDRLVYARGKRGENGQLLFPELQQYMSQWGGYLLWKRDPDFSIDNHVQLRELESGDDISKVIVEYLKQPLAEGRSPWHVLVVNDDTGGGAPHYRLLFKLHHGLADGYGITHAIMSCADEPGVYIQPRPTPIPSWKSRVVGWITFPFRFLAEFTKLVMLGDGGSLPQLAVPPETACGCGPRDHLHHIPSSAAGGQLVKIDQIKGIAKKQGVCFTSVLVAAVAGGMRSFILEKYGEEAASAIPEHLASPQAVPTPNRRHILMNAITTITCRLPIGLPSSRARLVAMQQWLNDRKHSVEPVVTGLLFNILFSWLPSGIRPQWKLVFPLLTSIVPGPLQKVRFGGQDVDGMRAMVAASTSSVYVVMLSYNGNLEWLCSGDARGLAQEDVQHIGDLIASEFGTMAKLRERNAEKDYSVEV